MGSRGPWLGTEHAGPAAIAWTGQSRPSATGDLLSGYGLGQGHTTGAGQLALIERKGQRDRICLGGV